MSCEHRSSTVGAFRFSLALAAMVGSVIAITVLAERLNLSGVRLIPIMLPLILAMVWMGYESIRWSRESAQASAMRAYSIRLTVNMVLYVVLLVGVGFLFRQPRPPQGAWALVLAMLPALPILGVFWTIGRLVVETTDEYQRLLLVKQILLASSISLCIATIWGFLENFDQAPHVNGFHISVLWFALFGISGAFVRLRA